MNKATFQYLCNELRGRLQHLNLVREAISVEKRIAITLWRLGTNQDYRSVAHLFGVGTSYVCVIVHEVCKAIVNYLLDKYISIPSREWAIEVIRDLKRFGDSHSVLEPSMAPTFQFLHLMAVPLSTITEKDSIQLFYSLQWTTTCS